MKFLRAVNIFPWDIAAEGAGACAGALTRLGCNCAILSPNYHRARLFRPRAVGFYNRPIDWCDFTPNRGLYTEPDLLPEVNPDQCCVEASYAFASAARTSGLDLVLAAIGCHNSTIGLNHPELCMENAFGDRYAFALCPAQPRVRALLGSLVQDLARQFKPAGILLDSFTYLDAVHREHHELMFISPGAFGKYLLSLCFCEACASRMREAGLDPAALRSLAKRLIHAAVSRGPEPRLPDPDRDELTGLLMEWPEFQALARVRSLIVEELLAHVKGRAGQEGVTVHSQSGLLARPTARAWTEGAGLRKRAESCDKIFLQAHWPSAREAIQDLTWAATVLPPERLVFTTMCSEDNIPSEADLVQRAVAAKRIGASGISFYNYGLLSAERLEWIHTANRKTA